MDNRPLTEAEHTRLRELVARVIPLASLISMNIDDDDIVLLERAQHEVAGDLSMLSDMEILLLASGTNPRHSRLLAQAKVNAPVLQAMVALWRTVREGIATMEEFDKAVAQRATVHDRPDI